MAPRSGHVLSCIAPYAGGGLGQHFAQVIEATRASYGTVHYFTARAKSGDDATIISDGLMPGLIRWTPLRFSPGGINFLENDRFDRAVARRLRGRLESFTGFGGQSLHSFRRARELNCGKLVLLAANTHVDNVAAQHAKALARWPIERSWLNDAQRSKTLAEYEMADEILIASDYAWQSFVKNGVPERKLRRIHYYVDPRFHVQHPHSETVFRIIYIGSITVMKGVPALLEAFAQLPYSDAELLLVGGTATRGMSRYLRRWLQRDPRIKLSPGDPLPHLLRSSVCAHPSFEDNLAYAVVESLAADVPVLATEDTGAKEYINPKHNGDILPTGDVEALVDRLTTLYQEWSR